MECFFYAGSPKSRIKGEQEDRQSDFQKNQRHTKTDFPDKTRIKTEVGEAFGLDIKDFEDLQEIMNTYVLALNSNHTKMILGQSIMGTPKNKEGLDIKAEDIYYNEPVDKFLENALDMKTYYITYGIFKSEREKNNFDFYTEIKKRSSHHTELLREVPKILEKTPRNNE